MAWEPPVEDFFPKVSPELQAERDRAANNLRSTYEPGSQTVQDDLAAMRYIDGGKKPPKESTPAQWTPPAEDFKQEQAWSPPQADFDNSEQPWFKGDPTANIINTARKFSYGLVDELGKKQNLMPVWDAAAGALKTFVQGIPEMFLSTGEGIYNYVKDAFGKDLTDDQVQAIIDSRPFTHALSERINKFTGSENNTQFKNVEDFMGSVLSSPVEMAKGVGPRTGLAAETLLAVAGAKGVRDVFKGHEEAPTVGNDLRNPPKNEAATEPSKAANEPKGPNDYDITQPDLFDDRPRQMDPWKVDENGMPYQKEVSEPIQRDLFDPENIAHNEETASLAKKQAEEDIAWENYKDSKPDESKPFEPSQGSAEVEKILPPIKTRKVNKGTFGQSGAADFSDIFKRIADLKSKGKMFEDTPEVYNLGDAVRLASGQQGTVIAKTDSGYQIRLDPRSGGGFDFVPAESILSRSMQGGVGKKGFKQGGAVDPEAFRFVGAAFRNSFSGKIFDTGGMHLLKNLPPEEQARPAGVLEPGFMGSDGKFYTRKEAHAKLDQIELASNVQGGEIHSSNLFPRKLGGTGKKGFKQGGGVNFGAFFGKDKSTVEGTDFIRQHANDFRDWGQLKEALKFGPETPLSAKEDFGKASTTFNVMPVLSQLKYKNSRAVQIFKNIVSRANELDNQSIQLYRDAIEHTTAFAKLPSKSQGRVRNVQVAYDGILNDELTSRGLQWPTADMLREKGLNDTEIQAYLEETKGVDKAWDMIENSLSLMGTPVTRIPGMFPHFWTGSYKVKVLSEDGGLIAMHPFSTRLGAKAAAKALIDEGKTVMIDEPSSHIQVNDIAAQMIEAMQVHNGKSSGFAKAVREAMIKFDELSKRGIIKSALERDANVKGYDAERGIQDGLLDHANNRRIIQAYKELIESSSQFWRNTRIAHDIYGDFLRESFNGTFENTPYFKDAVTAFIQRATGNPINNFKYVDELARSIGVSLGVNPNLVGGTIRNLGAFMTASKLIFWAPRFLAAQTVQPLAAAADIAMMHTRFMKDTGKAGDWLGAYNTMLKEFVLYEAGNKLGVRSAEHQEALDWARKNNKIDVYTADHINPVKSVDAKFTEKAFYEVPRHIEERGRAISFLAMYDYYKKVMPKEDALHAAANGADIMMGNYQGMNSASMFTDTGVTGRAVRPFALIRNAYFGKALMALELAKEGSPVPLAMMAGSYMVFAGAVGMFGANEYDLFAKWYNTNVKPDEPFPRVAELLRKHGAPNWATYGVLATSLKYLPGMENTEGVDIGPSLAAPAMNEIAGVPALDAGLAFLKLMQQGYSAASGNGVNWQSVYAASRPALPSLVNAQIEENLIAPMQSGNAPGATSFDATIKRTPEERNTYLWTGAKAISETKQREDLNLYKSRLVNNKEWKAQQVSKIVDAINGAPGLTPGELIQKALEPERGFDNKGIKQAIKEEMINRHVEEQTRNLQSIAKSKNAPEKEVKMRLLRELGALP